MLNTNPTRPLLNLLILDAGTCAAMGIALVLGAGFLNNLMAIPAPLLLYAGVILLPVAVFMAVTAIWMINSRTAVWLIIAGNALWVAASLGLIFGGWIAPNTLGYVFIGLQAVVVALLAVLEYLACAGAARILSESRSAGMC